MTEPLQKIDHSGLATNQASIIVLLLIAFITNTPWLVTIVAAAMLLGTILKIPGFGFLYVYFLKPRELVKPDVYPDNPEPHRFAQGFGATVLIAATIALFIGSTITGWVLTWIVIALAALNLFVGFCAGCAVYYWLNQLKVPGFNKSAPDGRFPGLGLKKGSSER
jgi:cytosine/uracil/thiamine/allantoin permease